MNQTLPPATERHFEDYPVGAVFDLGSFSLSEDEMLGFARRYDPQTMHTDPAWAAQGPFGGLIASGWHTVAALMPLIVRQLPAAWRPRLARHRRAALAAAGAAR